MSFGGKDEVEGMSLPGSASTAPFFIGMVEAFEPRHVIGWVEADRSKFPIKVSLFVNDLEVASTWADEPSRHNTSRMTRGFRIVLKDIWQFCLRTDKLTVRIDGHPLPIAQKGSYKRPGRGGGTRSLRELEDLLRNGHVFSQVGRLQLSKKLDQEWQAAVLGLYRKVSDVVQREFGYEPFIVYGTLLGFVRENGFIGHDIDFDAAYLSRHTDGPSAAAELRDIAFALIEAGFRVECKRTALHVHDPDDFDVRIDLFDIYFNDDGELSFPFGVAGVTKILRGDWQGLVESEMAGLAVRVPANASEMVEHLYGPSWRTPIAGFNWNQARTSRAKEGWTPLEYSEEVYWADFYAHNELSTGSSFFESIVARGDIPRAVLDIGCGDGRDTFAFARSGFNAIGLDRSHVGIEHASRKASSAGLGAVLSFVADDVSDADAVRSVLERAREAAAGGAVLVYMRFFLHSIPEDVQDALISTLANAAREGDMLAAEFRTEDDAKNHKVYGGHYRRFQDGFAFGRSLHERYGFDLLHEEEGSGLSPYKGEDPVLYRVVARKTVAAR